MSGENILTNRWEVRPGIEYDTNLNGKIKLTDTRINLPGEEFTASTSPKKLQINQSHFYSGELIFFWNWARYGRTAQNRSSLCSSICLDFLYRNSLSPRYSWTCVLWILIFANTSVEFNFNSIMYRPIDAPAMGSSLDPALANVFVSCNEERLFDSSLSFTIVAILTILFFI